MDKISNKCASIYFVIILCIYSVDLLNYWVGVFGFSFAFNLRLWTIPNLIVSFFRKIYVSIFTYNIFFIAQSNMIIFYFAFLKLFWCNSIF